MTDCRGALVSVVITTHDRANLLPRAIESVLTQTYPHLDIIVVDDGSRDGTKKVVNSYQQKCDQLRYLRHDTPRGACAARNHGIREARGEFIAGLDDDDEWLPRRVEALLENYGDEYAYLCSEDLIIEPHGRWTRKGKSTITLEDMLYRNITGNQVLARRRRVLEVGGFDETLSSAQDYDLWLRFLERYGPAKRVKEVLQIIHREHETERVSISRGKISGEWHLYMKHKNKMNRSQRRVHLLELKRLKRKKLKLRELFPILKTGCFQPYSRYYIRKALGRV